MDSANVNHRLIAHCGCEREDRAAHTLPRNLTSIKGMQRHKLCLAGKEYFLFYGDVFSHQFLKKRERTLAFKVIVEVRGLLWPHTVL